MLRADYMHWSMPFYVEDVSSRRFWYLWGRGGSRNQSPTDTEEQLNGRVNSYTQIFDYARMGTTDLSCLRVNYITMVKSKRNLASMNM